MKMCSVTFYSQGSSAFLVSSITGIFPTILHDQLVYDQNVSGCFLLHGVFLSLCEKSWALPPGHLVIRAWYLTGQRGFATFFGLLTFQLLLEYYRCSCQRHQFPYDDFKTLESEHWHQKTHYNPQRGCTVLPKFTYNQSMCSKETYNPPIHKFKESHKYN